MINFVSDSNISEWIKSKEIHTQWPMCASRLHQSCLDFSHSQEHWSNEGNHGHTGAGGSRQGSREGRGRDREVGEGGHFTFGHMEKWALVSGWLYHFLKIICFDIERYYLTPCSMGLHSVLYQPDNKLTEFTLLSLFLLFCSFSASISVFPPFHFLVHIVLFTLCSLIILSVLTFVSLIWIKQPDFFSSLWALFSSFTSPSSPASCFVTRHKVKYYFIHVYTIVIPVMHCILHLTFGDMAVSFVWCMISNWSQYIYTVLRFCQTSVGLQSTSDLGIKIK